MKAVFIQAWLAQALAFCLTLVGFGAIVWVAWNSVLVPQFDFLPISFPQGIILFLAIKALTFTPRRI